jgi:hypothetical protein
MVDFEQKMKITASLSKKECPALEAPKFHLKLSAKDAGEAKRITEVLKNHLIPGSDGRTKEDGLFGGQDPMGMFFPPDFKLDISEEEGAFVNITVEPFYGEEPFQTWEQAPFETLKETPFYGILHLKDGTSGTMIFSKSFDDLAASPDVKVQELFAGVKYEIEWGVAAELKKMIAARRVLCAADRLVGMLPFSLIAMDVQGAVGYNQKALNEFKTPMSDMTWGGSLKDMVAAGTMEGTEEPRAMALDVFKGLKGIESAHFSFSLPETVFDESGRQDSYRSVNLSMEYENFNNFTFAETVLTTLTTMEKEYQVEPGYGDYNKEGKCM